jgi:hypothetical protein
MEASPARLLRNAQKSWGVAGATMAVFHPSGCSTQSRLEIRHPGDQCSVQIASPPQYFHVATGGHKDSQANLSADRDVNARYFDRAVIRSIFIGQRRSCVSTRSGADVL